jgi:hypothetical protein
MKVAKFGIIILLVSPLAIAAWPQQNSSSSQSSTTNQQESVADAARRAKEQKKEPKAAKVWDNDNIPTTGQSISVVGQPSEPAPAESSETAKPEQKKAAAMTPEEKTDLQSKLDDAKAQLASFKTDLDVIQRKYVLDEQAYTSNPNHESDAAGAAALDDEKKQIADKQEQIADTQKKIDDLEAQLSAAAGDSSK